MKDSQQVLAEMNKKYEVFIVSSALEFPQSLPEKYAWLQEHFPFIGWQQIVFCGSKVVIKGDFMIDDYPKNLDYFTGEKLLYTAPHNQLLEGYRRVDNWQELATVFL
jgi:5'(3')-deoxyribonucleotidase